MEYNDFCLVIVIQSEVFLKNVNIDMLTKVSSNPYSAIPVKPLADSLPNPKIKKTLTLKKNNSNHKKMKKRCSLWFIQKSKYRNHSSNV